jgi:hypothetical protein
MWTIENGKILFEGREQDSAEYLWTLLKPEGESLSASRRLIIDEKRLPILKRLGFGSERAAALAALRRAFGHEEIVPLILEQKPVVPEHYKAEVGRWLRSAKQEKMAAFLGC